MNLYLRPMGTQSSNHGNFVNFGIDKVIGIKKGRNVEFLL